MKQIKHVKSSIALSWIILLLLGFSNALVFGRDVEKNPLYMNNTQSYEARVDDLLSRMTLEEKLSQMMSRTPVDLTRFGIPGYEWSGQSAHCCESRYGGTVTIFPHAIAQASTWNKELIYQVGTAISDESRARVNHGLRIDFTEHWYKSKMRLWGAPQDPEKFREAREAAKIADIAIVVIGTDETVEKEGVDRSSLELPGDQKDLIKAVHEANPKTIVVMQNGSPLAINWTNDNIPAILETFYNGEEGGNALADVLFGDYNPAGRLPLTFYKSDDQLPSISDYDIRKGRTYMYPVRNFVNPASQNEEPLYPFGYGLSYTEFSYSPLKISSENIDPTQSVTISIMVTNIGERVGDEVVQLYVRDEEASVPRPIKQLMGFERIYLAPNESKIVQFVLPAKNLSFWDVAKKAFVVEPGMFEVLIGSSSVDIKSKGRFMVN